MNGTTIEIVNTDAEGRLVLADVLWYASARSHAPRRLRDAAGAMEKALGDLYAGVFGGDDDGATRSSTPATAAATSPGASDPPPVPPGTGSPLRI